MTYFMVRAAAVLVALGLIGMSSSAQARSSRVVPTDYPTVQSAIDAASPGDTVTVRSGTYTEQLRIRKDLEIVGAGAKSTIIRAPSTLVLGELGETSIVEIFDGASVKISRLTVSGPGAGTCQSGALNAGIRVHGEAHLDFSFGAVRDIHDYQWPRVSGAVRASTSATSRIQRQASTSDTQRFRTTSPRESWCSGSGSTANITHNTVTGPGIAGGVATDGIGSPIFRRHHVSQHCQRKHLPTGQYELAARTGSRSFRRGNPRRRLGAGNRGHAQPRLWESGRDIPRRSRRDQSQPDGGQRLFRGGSLERHLPDQRRPNPRRWGRCMGHCR